MNILPFSRLLSSIGLLAFLITAGDAQNFYPPEPAASTAINFDNRGFLINGQRTFILSASVEYARVPRALWRDRLLRIKRSGFNCIELYTFWNFHEIQEGKFDFTGDKDLGAFLDLAHEIGLYATVRVGPYVCAEWENGGYPMWLRFKPPMCVRTNDPLFLNYVDRWYDHILPIVASRQIQRGGPVIMVQLENEDPRGWGASHGDPCFAHLLAKARALGIAVPTFFSGMNHGGDPAPKQPISSANRPNPWYSTEYWSGWYNWYGSLDPKPGGTLTHYSRAAWRFLENGGNGFNIYMFHGGTNFANWNNEETAASYDYSGAVGQAGDLRNIYYRYKRVALFATSFESILENCDDSSATYKNEAAGVTIAARTGPSGTLLFLDNPLTVPATAKLSNGNEMKLDAGDVVGLVRDFPLTNTFKIESSAARILGLVRQGGITTLVLYGPTGDSGQVQFTVTAAQGQKITPGVSGWTSNASNPNSYGLTVAFLAMEPRVYELAVGDKKLRVLAVNTELADHTWFVHSRDDSLIVCGPSYVGDVTAGPSGMRFTAEDALDAKASTAAWVYDSSDNTTNFAPTPFSSINSSAPALAAWQCASASPEADPSFDDLHWKSSDDPLPMGADGDNSAYAWYRTSVHADAPGQKFLQIPFIGDNAIVFVNGVRTPSTAAGPSMVPVTLQAGANSIAILASHKGRSKFGNCGPIDLIDRKGLIGPIRLSNADTPPSALPDGKFRAYWEKYPSIDTLVDPALDTSDPKWRDFGFYSGLGNYTAGRGRGILRENFACYRTLLSALAGPNRILHFGFAYDKAIVYLNGQKLYEQTVPGVPFDVPLDAAWKEGAPNLLALIVETDRRQNTVGLASLSSGTQPPIVKGWKIRGNITDFQAESLKWDSVPKKAPGVPSYYRTHFSVPPGYYENATPILRFSVKGLSRGFVWLNGHNLGRFPETTNVDGLYLPECWIKKGGNDLVVFDEEGAPLSDVRLYVETIASRRVYQVQKS